MADGRNPIRAARRGDIPALVDLRVQFLGEAVHNEARRRLLPDVRERSQHAFPVWMEQPGRLLLVAEGGHADGADPSIRHPSIVGYAMGTAEVHPPLLEHQHVGVIAECYVMPAWRGHGLYGALIDLLSEMLVSRDAQVLRADLPIGHAQAIECLHQRGFLEVQYTMDRPLSGD